MDELSGFRHPRLTNRYLLHGNPAVFLHSVANLSFFQILFSFQYYEEKRPVCHIRRPFCDTLSDDRSFISITLLVSNFQNMNFIK